MAETHGEDLTRVPTPELREQLQSVADGGDHGDLWQLYRRLGEMNSRTAATLDGAEYDLKVLQTKVGSCGTLLSLSAHFLSL